jgi:hypothetical protein
VREPLILIAVQFCAHARAADECDQFCMTGMHFCLSVNLLFWRV